MAKSDEQFIIFQERRAEDGTSVKLFQFADGRQDLVVEITDEMQKFLATGRSPTEFNYGHNQMLLARYDPSDRLLTTFPTNLFPNHSSLGLPKYSKVRWISLEQALPLFDDENGEFNFGQFPSGFVDKPLEGFGLAYSLRFIVEAIEEIPGVAEIRLYRGSEVEVKGSIFRLPMSIYEPIRKTLNRTHKAALAFANDEKRSFLQSELVNPHLPDTEQKPVVMRTKAELSAILGDAINAPGRHSKAKAANQSAAVSVVKTSAKALITNHHDELLELSREIELVTLEDLIAKFEARLAEPSLKEGSWQKFLSKNPFILRLAFGLPAIVFKEQMPVGG